MGDAFFRFLGLNGLRILDSSQNEALVTYISSTDWILIDVRPIHFHPSLFSFIYLLSDRKFGDPQSQIPSFARTGAKGSRRVAYLGLNSGIKNPKVELKISK